LTNLVYKKLIRENLNKCLELADKYRLSNMTMNEIFEEVKALDKT